METTLHSELATPADLDPLLDRLVTPYLEESFPETFADVQWRRTWARRLAGWLADENVTIRLLRGEPWLGFAVVRLLDREAQRHAEILDVYVDPGSRRQGIGSRLIRDAMAWAAQQGAREMAIGVKVRNQAGLDFLASLGFAPQRLLLSRWI